ncbi:MAG: hypothetical protein ABW187_08365 [Dokdonella sp.]
MELAIVSAEGSRDVLILPLHRTPTRANSPRVTLALFCFLQSGDDHVRERALDYYASADLAEEEFPAYRG